MFGVVYVLNPASLDVYIKISYFVFTLVHVIQIVEFRNLLSKIAVDREIFVVKIFSYLF